MPKVTKLKPTATKPAASRPPAGGSRRALLNLSGFIAFAGCLFAVVVTTRRYVEQRVTAPVGPLRVALVNQPVWMSDFLAQQIAATVPRAASSAFDHELLVAAAKKLQGNPWVRDVHSVRRVYGQRPGDTLEVDCEFRAPVALVQWGDYYWLVDGDGEKLPEQFTANHVAKIVLGGNRRMNIRIMDRDKQPPTPTGQKLARQDLADGLGVANV